jgi:hypothetical protein
VVRLQAQAKRKFRRNHPPAPCARNPPSPRAIHPPWAQSTLSSPAWIPPVPNQPVGRDEICSPCRADGVLTSLAVSWATRYAKAHAHAGQLGLGLITWAAESLSPSSLAAVMMVAAAHGRSSVLSKRCRCEGRSPPLVCFSVYHAGSPPPLIAHCSSHMIVHRRRHRPSPHDAVGSPGRVRARPPEPLPSTPAFCFVLDHARCTRPRISGPPALRECDASAPPSAPDGAAFVCVPPLSARPHTRRPGPRTASVPASRRPGVVSDGRRYCAGCASSTLTLILGAPTGARSTRPCSVLPFA